jgi:iron complex outermembrane receptor protein
MEMTSSTYLRIRTWIGFFLLLSAPLVAQEEVLKGFIYEGSSAKPLEGVRVTVHENQAYTFTDSTGFFQLSLLPGHYHLHFEKAQYLAEDLDLDFPAVSSLKVSMVPSNIELEEILIEDGFLNRTKRNNSQSIISLSPDEAEKSSQLDLASLLSQMPGVNALNTGLGISKPVVRGFSGNRVAVIDEGVKQEGQQWGMDHGLEVDPFSVYNVELVKGPAALQYGSDAIGGALRLLPEPLSEKTWSGGLQSAWHSNNNTQAYSGYAAYSRNSLNLRLRLSHKQYHDFRVPAEEFVYNGFLLPITDQTLKNTAGQQSSGQLELAWNRKTYRARYKLSLFQQKQGIYSGATGIPRAFDVGFIGPTGDIDLPRQEINHYKLYTLQNIKIGKHWLELEAGYQLNDRAEKSLPHAHGFEELDSNNTLALGLLLHSGQANIRYKTHWGSADLVLGSSQQVQYNQQSGFEYLIPSYNSYQSGIFAIAKGAFSENLKWDGGLRWEYKQHQSALSTTPWWNNIDSLVLRSPAINRRFSNIAAAFGVVFQIKESWLLKGHLARSFRAPNVAELSSNGVHHGTFRHEVGDATINPEIAWQLDAGIEFQNRDLLLRLSPYFYYFENYIFLRPTARFSLLPEAGQLYVYQQAPIIQGGTELYVDWHPWAKLHWSNASELLINENLETGLPLPFSPPWSNLSSLRWEEDRWSISIDWRYTFAQNRVDRNENTSPQYHLFHFKSSWNWQSGRHQVQLSASIQNIFNRAYLQHLSRYRILNLPEQGRNLVLGLSYKF